MLISVDDKALTWFKDEFGMNRPFYIRLFPQYAGFGVKHKGYSLAFSAEVPANAGFIQEKNGITFYVEGNDTWFFEDTNTFLSFDDGLQELLVKYEGVH